MKSRIIKWIPNAKTDALIYNICSITDDYNGLSVVLESNNSTVLTIKWDAVESYCCSTEEVRFRFVANDWQQIRKKYPNWFFFRIIDSPYINWLYEESGEVITKEIMKHFMIVSPDYILDIVSRSEPYECIIKEGRSMI